MEVGNVSLVEDEELDGDTHLGVGWVRPVRGGSFSTECTMCGSARFELIATSTQP